MPLDLRDYPCTVAVVLRMRKQVLWIGQLKEHKFWFVLHVDGKHKLHHGKWILISVGTHAVEYCKERKSIVHQFRPLLYMFTKNHESAECITYLLNCLNFVSVRCVSQLALAAIYVYWRALDFFAALATGMSHWAGRCS